MWFYCLETTFLWSHDWRTGDYICPRKSNSYVKFPTTNITATTSEISRFGKLLPYIYSRLFQNINPTHKQWNNKNTKILIEEALTAFHNAKKALADFTKLSYICNDDTVKLSQRTDASGD